MYWIKAIHSDYSNFAPVGMIIERIDWTKEIAEDRGFLLCDGTEFDPQHFPALSTVMKEMKETYGENRLPMIGRGK